MSVRTPTRTKAFVATEALGRALGRWGMRDPHVRAALAQGFSEAIREHVAGRTPKSEDDLAAIVLALIAVAEARGHTKSSAEKPKKQRKSR